MSGRGRGAGSSRPSIPCDRRGTIPSIANSIVLGINRGLLPSTLLKHLSKKQIKAALAQGVLSPSVLRQGEINIEPSEIIDDVIAGRLPEEALEILTEEQLQQAVKQGKIQPPVSYITSLKSDVPRGEGRPVSTTRPPTTEKVERARNKGNTNIAVADKTLPVSVLAEASIRPSEIIKDVATGKLPENALHALTPEQLQKAVHDSDLRPSVAPRIIESKYDEAVKDTVAEGRLLPSALQKGVELTAPHVTDETERGLLLESSPQTQTLGTKDFGTILAPEPGLPSTLPRIQDKEGKNSQTSLQIIDGVSRGSLPMEELKPIPVQDVHKSIQKGKIQESSLTLLDKEKAKQAISNRSSSKAGTFLKSRSRVSKDILSERGISETVVTIGIIPESPIDGLTPEEIYQAIQDGNLSSNALRQVNPEFVKQAVTTGRIPPSALLDAGIRPSEIMRDVISRKLPESALKALNKEQLLKAVQEGKITPSMAQAAYESEVRESKEIVKNDVLKSSSSIRFSKKREVDSQHPDQAIDATLERKNQEKTPEFIYELVKQGKINKSAMKDFDPSVLKEALVQGKVSIGALEAAAIHPSELIEDVAKRKLPRDILDFVTQSQIQNAVDNGRIRLCNEAQNVATKESINNALLSGAIPPEKLREVLTPSLIIAQVNDGILPTKALQALTNDEIKNALQEGNLNETCIKEAIENQDIDASILKKIGETPSIIAEYVSKEKLPEEALQALSQEELKKVVGKGLIRESVAARALGAKKAAEEKEKVIIKKAVADHELPPQDLKDKAGLSGSPIAKDVAAGKLTEAALDALTPQELLTQVKGGTLPRDALKHLDGEEVKRAVAKGILRPSALADAGIRPSEIARDVAAQKLPPTALQALSPKEIKKAAEDGLISQSVAKEAIDAEKAVAAGNKDTIKRAVAEGVLSPQDLKDKAGLSGSQIATEVAAGKLPEAALDALTSQELLTNVQDGTLPRDALKHLDGEEVKKAVAKGILRPSALADAGIRPSEIARDVAAKKLPPTALQALSPKEIKKAAEDGLISQSVAKEAIDAEKAVAAGNKDTIKRAVAEGVLSPQDLKDKAGLSGSQIATEVAAGKLPEAALDALTSQELLTNVQDGTLPRDALKHIDGEEVKKAVAQGILRPSALADAGIRPSEIARDVAAQKLPLTALQALSPKEIKKAAEDGLISQSVAKGAIDAEKAVAAGNKDAIKKAVGDSVLSPQDLKDKAGLSGSQIATEVAAGKLPEAALDTLTPQELFTNVQDGTLPRDALKHLDGEEVKKAVAKGILRPSALADAGIRASEIARDVAAQKLPPAALQALSPKEIKKAAEDGLISQSVAKGAIDAEKAVAAGNKDAIKKAVGDSVLSPQDLKDKAGLSGSQIATEVAAGKLPEAALDTLTPQELFTNVQDGTLPRDALKHLDGEEVKKAVAKGILRPSALADAGIRASEIARDVAAQKLPPAALQALSPKEIKKGAEDGLISQSVAARAIDAKKAADAGNKDAIKKAVVDGVLSPQDLKDKAGLSGSQIAKEVAAGKLPEAALEALTPQELLTNIQDGTLPRDALKHLDGEEVKKAVAQGILRPSALVEAGIRPSEIARDVAAQKLPPAALQALSAKEIKKAAEDGLISQSVATRAINAKKAADAGNKDAIKKAVADGVLSPHDLKDKAGLSGAQIAKEVAAGNLPEAALDALTPQELLTNVKEGTLPRDALKHLDGEEVKKAVAKGILRPSALADAGIKPSEIARDVAAQKLPPTALQALSPKEIKKAAEDGLITESLATRAIDAKKAADAGNKDGIKKAVVDGVLSPQDLKDKAGLSGSQIAKEVAAGKLPEAALDALTPKELLTNVQDGTLPGDALKHLDGEEVKKAVAQGILRPSALVDAGIRPSEIARDVASQKLPPIALQALSRKEIKKAADDGLITQSVAKGAIDAKNAVAAGNKDAIKKAVAGGVLSPHDLKDKAGLSGSQIAKEVAAGKLPEAALDALTPKELLTNVQDGTLPRDALKHLDGEEIKKAVAQGILRPSALADAGITASEIARDVAAQKLPPAALQALSPKDIKMAAEDGLISQSVAARAIDAKKAADAGNKDAIKKAVADGVLSPHDLKDKAGLSGYQIAKEVAAGKLPEAALEALTPQELLTNIQDGTLPRDALKHLDGEEVKKAVAKGILQPSALADAGIRPSEIARDVAAQKLPPAALQALSPKDIKKAAEDGLISQSVAARAIDAKKAADAGNKDAIKKAVADGVLSPHDLKDKAGLSGYQIAKEVAAGKLPKAALDALTPQELLTNVQDGTLPRDALKHLDGEEVKKAVAKGILRPSALADAGIRASEIARDVAAQKLPPAALQALSAKEIKKAAEDGLISQSVAARAIDAKKAADAGNKDAIKKAVADGVLSPHDLKDKAGLSGSQIAKEVAAGKLPESALDALTPQELLTNVQDGTLPRDALKHLDGEEVKKAVAKGILRPSALADAGIRTSEIARDVAAQKLPPTALQALSPKEIKKAAEDGLITQSLATRAIDAKRAANGGNKDAIKKAVADGVLSPQDLKDKAGLSGSQIAKEVAAGKLPEAALDALTPKELLTNVQDGTLPRDALKHLDGEEIKKAVAQGILRPSALADAGIRASEIARDVAAQKLPPAALQALSPKEIKKAAEDGLISQSVAARAIDAKKAADAGNKDAIKKAVADGVLSPQDLKDKAGLSGSQIAKEVAAGKLPEAALDALTPKELLTNVQDGTLPRDALKHLDGEEIKKAVAQGILRPSALADAGIRASEIARDVAAQKLPPAALQALSPKEIKKAAEDGLISQSVAARAIDAKKAADAGNKDAIKKAVADGVLSPHDLKDKAGLSGSQIAKEVAAGKLPEAALDALTPQELLTNIQDGTLPRDALKHLDGEEVKKAVAKGILRPSALADAGIRPSEIARDVAAQKLPPAALQALSSKEIKKAAEDGLISQSVAARAIDAKRAADSGNKDAIKKAVADGVLSPQDLKDKAYLSGSQIAKEVAAGKLPEAALDALTPQELLTNIQDGTLPRDALKHLDGEEVKKAVAKGILRPSALADAGIRPSEIARDVAALKLPPAALQALSPKDIKNAAEDGLISQSVAARAIDAKKAADAGNKDAIKKAVADGVLSPHDLKDKAGLSGYQIAKEVAAGKLPEAALEALTPQELLTNIQDGTLPRDALKHLDGEEVKKAVAKGILRPSALADAGIRPSEIARDVAAQKLPPAALQALSPKDIKKAAEDGLISQSVAARAIDAKKAADAGDKDAIKKAVADGVLSPHDLKDKAGLSGSQIAKDVAAGKLPEAALEALTPQELLTNIQDGTLPRDALKHLDGEEVKKAVAQGILRPSALVEAGIRPSEIARDVAAQKLPPAALQALSAKEIKKAAEDGLISQSLATRAINAKKAADAGNKDAIKKAVVDGVLSPHDLKDKAGLSCSQIAKEVAAGNLPEAALDALTPQELLTNARDVGAQKLPPAAFQSQSLEELKKVADDGVMRESVRKRDFHEGFAVGTDDGETLKKALADGVLLPHELKDKLALTGSQIAAKVAAGQLPVSALNALSIPEVFGAVYDGYLRPSALKKLNPEDVKNEVAKGKLPPTALADIGLQPSEIIKDVKDGLLRPSVLDAISNEEMKMVKSGSFLRYIENDDRDKKKSGVDNLQRIKKEILAGTMSLSELKGKEALTGIDIAAAVAGGKLPVSALNVLLPEEVFEAVEKGYLRPSALKKLNPDNIRAAVHEGKLPPSALSKINEVFSGDRERDEKLASMMIGKHKLDDIKQGVRDGRLTPDALRVAGMTGSQIAVDITAGKLPVAALNALSADEVDKVIKGGNLSPSALKKLNTDDLKKAVLEGKLPLSALTFAGIRASGIARDVAAGKLPPSALQTLSPKELKKVVDDGLIRESVASRASEAKKAAALGSKEAIKKTVASGALPLQDIKGKAGLTSSRIVKNVAAGKLPKSALDTLTPQELRSKFQDGTLPREGLKHLDAEEVKKAVAKGELRPSALTDAGIRASEIARDVAAGKLPSSALQTLSRKELKKAVNDGLIRKSVAAQASEAKKTAASRNKEAIKKDRDVAADKLPPEALQAVSREELKKAAENRLVRESVAAGASNVGAAAASGDVEAIKQAVTDGALPPQDLKYKGGLTGSQIAQDVASRKLPQSALQALTTEELYRAVQNGTLPPEALLILDPEEVIKAVAEGKLPSFVLCSFFECYRSIGSIDAENVKRAVIKGILPPAALKDMGGLTGCEIAAEVSSGKLPVSVLECLLPEEIYMAVTSGYLRPSVMSKLDPLELKGAVAAGRLHPDALVLAGFRRSDIVRDVACGILPESVLAFFPSEREEKSSREARICSDSTMLPFGRGTGVARTLLTTDIKKVTPLPCRFSISSRPVSSSLPPILSKGFKGKMKGIATPRRSGIHTSLMPQPGRHSFAGIKPQTSRFASHVIGQFDDAIEAGLVTEEQKEQDVPTPEHLEKGKPIGAHQSHRPLRYTLSKPQSISCLASSLVSGEKGRTVSHTLAQSSSLLENLRRSAQNVPGVRADAVSPRLRITASRLQTSNTCVGLPSGIARSSRASCCSQGHCPHKGMGHNFTRSTSSISSRPSKAPLEKNTHQTLVMITTSAPIIQKEGVAPWIIHSCKLRLSRDTPKSISPVCKLRDTLEDKMTNELSSTLKNVGVALGAYRGLVSAASTFDVSNECIKNLSSSQVSEVSSKVTSSIKASDINNSSYKIKNGLNRSIHVEDMPIQTNVSLSVQHLLHISSSCMDDTSHDDHNKLPLAENEPGISEVSKPVLEPTKMHKRSISFVTRSVQNVERCMDIIAMTTLRVLRLESISRRSIYYQQVVRSTFRRISEFLRKATYCRRRRGEENR